MGNVVFAGVDYAAILEAAEGEADVLVWDGGNNDFPFLRPDLHVVVVDALRSQQLDTHHPGEAVLRMADVVVVNKVDAAAPFEVQRALEALRVLSPRARVVRAASPVSLSDESLVHNRRALVVEDGPTLTHGGMSYGAGYVAAVEAGAAEIVDPRGAATPTIAALYERFPHMGRVLPAVGYDDAQLAALQETLRRAACDVIVSATPLDLARRVDVAKPIVRARYEYADVGSPTLAELLDAFVAEQVRSASPEPAAC